MDSINEENLERSEPSAAEPSSPSTLTPEFEAMASDICKDLTQAECTHLLEMIAQRQRSLGEGGEISMTDYESAKGME